MIKILFKKADDEIFAVFPYESFDGYLTCYAHIGQHSLCDINYAYDAKNASEDEYKDLLKELTNIYGKELMVLKKMPSRIRVAKWAVGGYLFA